MGNNICGNLFQRYLTETRGVFALKFALLTVPMLIATGMAIDVSRLTVEKQALQDATDSSALAAATAYAKMLSDPSYDETFFKTASEAVFRENVSREPSLQIDNHVVHMNDAGALVVRAQATVKPHFAQVFGYPKLSVSAESHAALPQSQIVEVALITDHSGSLTTAKGGRNFAALGNALDMFVDEISPSNNMGNIYVSFIPWAGTVNIGENRTSWINDYDQTIFGEGKWGGCVRARWGGLDVTDTPPSSGNKFDVFAWPDDQHNDWEGLSADRYVSISPYPYERTLRGPNHSCDNEILSLTNNKAELVAKIAEYKSHINHDIGSFHPWAMAWGYRTLSPKWKGLWGGPTPSNLPASGSKKVAIFLSDGLLKWNHPSSLGYYSPYGYVAEDFLGVVANGQDNTMSNRHAEMKKRFFEVCDNMKRDGIEVISIAYVFGKQDDEFMRSCATSPNHYFSAKDEASIKAVFSDIAANMTEGEVRLVK